MSPGCAHSGPASWWSRASWTRTTRAEPWKSGADAIVVSNHGGRQLDGAPSTISVLPQVACRRCRVGCEVFFDGGVMCGQDVLKAVALGARGCLMGKAFLYALGGRGASRVSRWA